MRMEETTDVDHAVIGTIVSEVCDEKYEQRVIDTSRELLRRMQLKLPAGSLSRGEASRSVIAIEMACRKLEAPYNRSALMKHLQSSQQDYLSAFNITKNRLELLLTSVPTIDKLSIHFGVGCKPSAYQLLTKYQSQYIHQLDPSLQQLNSSAFHAVAYWEAARQKKVKIDKGKFLQVAEVDKSTFNNILSLIDNGSATQKNNNRDLQIKADLPLRQLNCRGFESKGLTRYEVMIHSAIGKRSHSSLTLESSESAQTKSNVSNSVGRPFEDILKQSDRDSNKKRNIVPQTSHPFAGSNGIRHSKICVESKTNSNIHKIGPANNVCMRDRHPLNSLSEVQESVIGLCHEDSHAHRQLQSIGLGNVPSETRRLAEEAISEREKKQMERQQWLELREKFILKTKCASTAANDHTAIDLGDSLAAHPTR